MKDWVQTYIRPFALQLLNLGFDPRKLLHLRHLPTFLSHRNKWKQAGGGITHNYMILSDYTDDAGTARGHYFHQDLLVAKMIHDAQPRRHLDIGSRVDGFVAHLASFRPIEVVDIRPLPRSAHENIRFVQADLMSPLGLGTTDSLSCLHAIEHFGLGRYTDPIDPNGHNRGIDNLVSLVEPGGKLYISFPIGLGDEVHFNAHRVFHPESIFQNNSIASAMRLERFDYVDDAGDLHLNSSTTEVIGKIKFGCGIYTFKKK